jgi:hypothetical protein
VGRIISWDESAHSFQRKLWPTLSRPRDIRNSKLDPLERLDLMLIASKLPKQIRWGIHKIGGVYFLNQGLAEKMVVRRPGRRLTAPGLPSRTIILFHMTKLGKKLSVADLFPTWWWSLLLQGTPSSIERTHLELWKDRWNILGDKRIAIHSLSLDSYLISRVMCNEVANHWISRKALECLPRQTVSIHSLECCH